MHKIIVIVSLIVTLCVVNWSIASKEKHLSDGKTIYLELAPLDPRSLMQGDYMALRFKMANEVQRALPATRNEQMSQQEISNTEGNVVVTLDERNVATYSRIDNGEELADDEIKIQYRVRNNRVKFATNAFFFQEGNAKIYQPARYGQFKVDDNGELLLASMYDKDLKELGSTRN